VFLNLRDAFSAKFLTLPKLPKLYVGCELRTLRMLRTGLYHHTKFGGTSRAAVERQSLMFNGSIRKYFGNSGRFGGFTTRGGEILQRWGEISPHEG